MEIMNNHIFSIGVFFFTWLYKWFIIFSLIYPCIIQVKIVSLQFDNTNMAVVLKKGNKNGTY